MHTPEDTRPRPPRQRGRTPVIVLLSIAIASLAAGLGISHYLSARNAQAVPQGVIAAVLPGKGKALPDFQLKDDAGHPFDLATLQGHWSFLFFGYTHCPDVCPLTLNVFAAVENTLRKGPGGIGKTRFVFVSVDPGRDTPAVLGQYVHYFSPDFIGVTGAATEIATLTRRLGVMYSIEKAPGDTGDYTVNHSAHVLLIDPTGSLRAVFSPPHDPGLIADSFRKIRHFYGDLE